VLDRLLTLNRERHKEDVAQGLHEKNVKKTKEPGTNKERNRTDRACCSTFELAGHRPTRNDGTVSMNRERPDIPNELIEVFCRRHHIKKPAIFGSYLREDFGPESDIDLSPPLTGGVGEGDLNTQYQCASL